MPQYEFLERLDTAPEISKKKAISKSIGNQIVQEFVTAGLHYARIKASALSKYKNSRSAARGIGRVVKTLGHHGKIKVYSDKEYCYLEKVS